MSRIGKKIIQIPESVDVFIEENSVRVKGNKGEIKVPLYETLNLNLRDKMLSIERKNDSKKSLSIHGLTRSLVNNAIIGVSAGFSKELEMVGVGYRAKVEEKALILNIGYSHPVKIEAPQGIEFKVDKNIKINISGIDKQTVGEMAANIRKIRPPEPYKGKGIRYLNEIVRRKSGKAAKTVGIGK